MSSKIVHEKSNIAPLHIADIFEVPSTQVSFESSRTVWIEPQISLPSDGPITFEFTTAFDEYLRFDECLFYLKYEVKLNQTAAADNKKSNWEKIKSTDYLLHSMFKHVYLEINDTVLTQSVELYPYRAFFEAFFGFTPAAQTTHLALAGYGSTDGKYVQPSNISTWSATETKTTCTHELIGKLHLDLSFQHKAFLPNSKIVIKLYPHNPEFYLIKDAAATPTPTVTFKAARFGACMNKATTNLLTSHGKVLISNSAHTAKYPITRIEIKTASIGTGQGDYTINNIHIGVLPSRVFAALVTNKAFNGDILTDPLKFEPHSLSNITFFVNNDPIPLGGLNGQGILEYWHLMKLICQSGTQTDITPLTFEKFKSNPFYGVSLDPDCTPASGRTNHTNPKRVGDLAIKLKFSTPPTAALTLITWMEFENVIEVDRERNVSASWPL